LESLLHTFHNHVQALRLERQGLRADVATQRAHLSVAHHMTPGQAYEVATRRLAALDESLRQTSASLMPDHLIEALANFLNAPEPALSLAPFSITVDRLGIVRDQSDDDFSVHTLSFPELTARDQRQHLAMLVRINREEASEAVEMVRDQQHRFMLI
jgi:hypothetical protein